MSHVGTELMIESMIGLLKCHERMHCVQGISEGLQWLEPKDGAEALDGLL